MSTSSNLNGVPKITSQAVTLSETEQVFISHLDDFAREGRKLVEPKIPEVQCRIAGGWVRDKLLGLPSHDLDVTLSSCAGYPFAQAFVNYLQTVPTASDIPIRSIGKVSANPDQSKHLETATTVILGLDCDFVQLRSEVYADGSRIPSEVRIGTPLEDAERRDITINTLFYNVHTRSVEDWTGKGLSDLENKLIRTPLPPLQTFYDDPLRILRCLRFASRLGYSMDHDLSACLGDEGILEALRTRISRERVGIEVEKMLKGPNPFLSIQLISSLNLYPHIFGLPGTGAPVDAETFFPAPHPAQDAKRGAEIFQSFLSGPLHRFVHPSLLSKLDEGRQFHFWLAVTLLPFREGTVVDKRKEVSMADIVIRDGIKLGNAEREAVTRLYEAHGKLSPPQYNHYPVAQLRSSLGLILREPFINEPTTNTCWQNSILFSMLLDILPFVEAGNATPNADTINIMKRYDDFTSKIEELHLSAAIEEKPRLDGTAVNTLLGLKPSQLTKYLLIEVVRWQLDHPQKTIEDCKEFLLASQREGTLPTMESLGLAQPARKKQKKA